MIRIKINKTNPKFITGVKEELRQQKEKFKNYFEQIKKLETETKNKRRI